MEIVATEVEFMGTKMQFSCPKFAEAFKEKISDAARKRIWAYYCRGTKGAIQYLKLQSKKDETFRKSLRLIAQSMGAESYRDLFISGSVFNPKADDKVSRKELMRLVKSQEFRCALSGLEITPESSELDHIIPYSKGGKHEINNVQWLDKSINRMKGTLSNVEFIDLCKKVAAWNR